MGAEWGVIFIKSECADSVESLEAYTLKDLSVDREDRKMSLSSFKQKSDIVLEKSNTGAICSFVYYWKWE